MQLITALACAILTLAPTTTYSIDTNASTVRWKGTKALGLGSHEGTIRIQKGGVTMSGGTLKGASIVIDMGTIQVTDIPEEDSVPRNRIRSHLSNEDFFFVARHPVAVIKVVSATRKGNVYKVTSDITIRGVTRRITSPMTLRQVSASSVRISGQMKLKRQDWGASFGGRIRDQLVDDHFTLQFDVLGRAS